MHEALVQQAASQLTKGEGELLYWAFQALIVVGSVLGAAGAVIAFFLTRYWNSRDRAADKRERAISEKEAERSKQRDVLYESLKWFEGGTQKRSIGIAVVNTSWNAFEEFRSLWIEVFANQAIYLLTASDQAEKPHEHDNLRRIMDLLVQQSSRIKKETNELLADTIDRKFNGLIPGGLTLTAELKMRLESWHKVLKGARG